MNYTKNKSLNKQTMRYLYFLIAYFLMTASVLGQASGNVNYRNNGQNYNNQHHYNKTITPPLQPDHSLVLTVKGLCNIKADTHIAIFSITQVGKTTEEVNQAIDERINTVKKSLEGKTDISLFVDMVSFVPVYEYEVDKKIFSKRTYNEVPKGFELKKNLHIKYSNPDFLNQLITICASAEIYDLVIVDYISTTLEQKKKELLTKAQNILKEKIKNYQEMLGTDLTNFEKDLIDGFKIYYPSEMYDSYEAFSGSSLNLKKGAYVNNADKSVTLYYQSIVNKDFDFVIEPIVAEPVIQVIYEITMRIRREKKNENKKEYLIVTPSGEIKTLPIEKEK
jgi:uncharacterized protein YggE